MPSHEIKKEREERKKKNGKGNEGRKERGGREMIKTNKQTNSIWLLYWFHFMYLNLFPNFHIINLHNDIEEIRAHLLGEPMPRYKNHGIQIPGQEESN